MSTLTGSLSIVGDCVGTVRRSGVIIAMSSGLVASMALPAHAVNSPPEAAGPATASIPAIPATGSGEALFAAPEGGLLALPPDLAMDDVTVAAPIAATVDFDHSSFTVVPAFGSPRDANQGTDDATDARAGDTAGGTADDTAEGQDEDADEAGAPAARAERPAPKPAAPKPVAPKPAVQKTSASDDASTTAVSSSGLGSRAVAIAFRYEDTPYVWGGDDPRGFDCSGFTRYVYGQLGKKLGRTVSAQRGDVKFVPRSAAVPGDLVFFGNGHVGIYLGNNRMIDSPRRGKTIQARKIYSANVQFGKVLG